MDLEKIKQEKSTRELLEFGILNIDKPSGPTSFQADLFLKNKLGLNKSSHFGTLDPKVTGVLPVALNRACKLSGYFMHKDKTYVGIMRTHKEVKVKILQELIDNEFTGKIMQLPPKRSKVKRQEREREIKRFEILEKHGKEILFMTEVEAGTYIRKLLHDIGLRIGGAHMSELRRTKAGIFCEEDKNFVNSYQLNEAIEEYKYGKEEKLREMLIPAEIISDILPVVQAREEAIQNLWTGKPVFKIDIEEAEVPQRFVIFYKDKFIEVARRTDEGDIIARPEFVLQPAR